MLFQLNYMAWIFEYVATYATACSLLRPCKPLCWSWLCRPAALGEKETRRCWGMLSVAVQQTVATTALGRAWPAPLHPHQRDAPPLERMLELAAPAGSSRLPLRA